jgi:hypothetical protein
VFHQLSSIDLLRTKRAYLHLGKPTWEEVFLSKTNSIHTGKQCVDAAVSRKDVFLRRDTWVFELR